MTVEDLLTLVSGHTWDAVSPYSVEFVKIMDGQLHAQHPSDLEEMIEIATEVWSAIESCYNVDEQIAAETANPGKVIQIRRGGNG